MTKKQATRIRNAIDSLHYLFGEMGIPGETDTLEPMPEPRIDVVHYLTGRLQFWAGELAEDTPPAPARKQISIAVEIYEDLLSMYEEVLEAEAAKAERAKKRKQPAKQTTPEPPEPLRTALMNSFREAPRDRWSVN